MASRKRIVICYILLQASFWGMLSSICAYQAAKRNVTGCFLCPQRLQ